MGAMMVNDGNGLVAILDNDECSWAMNAMTTTTMIVNEGYQVGRSCRRILII
jgi:hypothetical protein